MKFINSRSVCFRSRTSISRSDSSHKYRLRQRRIIMGDSVMRWQILAKDPDKAAEFYTRLFDWKVNDDNALGYRMIDTGSERGIQGGIWPSPPEGHSFVQ